MQRLKGRLQAKFAGASSRLKGKNRSVEPTDGSGNPGDTAASVKSSIAPSPSAGNADDDGPIKDAQRKKANTQIADSVGCGSRNASGNQRFGLHVLAEPAPGILANVDIVLCHGLNGDPYKTWTAAGAEAPWPQVLLPTVIPRARIMTYGADFSYVLWLRPAGQNTIREHATNLVTDLALKRYETGTLDRPIIFIAYSLGGLVCENAVILSDNSPEKDHRQIAERTHGIVFLGTPHAGSDFTRFAKALTNIVSCSIVKKPNKAILDVLTRQSQVLASIQKDFQNLLELRQQNHKPPITIHCCQEELPVAGTGHRVVTPDSAAFPGYHTSSTIPANHMDLPKFKEKSDIGFQRVSGRLKQWTDALSTPIDLNELGNHANDLKELAAGLHAKWRHRGEQLHCGNSINWWWLYESYEYRTWSSDDTEGVEHVLWLSGLDRIQTSLYMSNLVSKLLENDLPASSNDTVYFYLGGLPSELHVPFANLVSIPPQAVALCVFIAQMFTPRGDYFESLSPKDQRAIMLALQAAKQILTSQLNEDDGCQPGSARQALGSLENSEALLWFVFGGLVTARHWRSLTIVLDGLENLPLDARSRLLEQLSKLQHAVSNAKGLLRLVVSSTNSSELHKAFTRIFPGFLQLDRDVEMADCLKSLKAHAGNRRRHDIERAKAYTGAWLFNSTSYETWKASDTSCMLSIQGKPGSGKSTLMKHILESLMEENMMWYDDEGLYARTAYKFKAPHPPNRTARQRSSESDQQPLEGEKEAKADEDKREIDHKDAVVVASYFFHARGGETSHSDMLQSLIYQVLSQDDRLFSACEKRYRKLREQSRDYNSLVVWGWEELKRALLEIVRYPISFDGRQLSIRYYFLIDALDESDDKKIEQILHLFRHELDESPQIIKTVLASRPIRNYERAQSTPSSFHTILEIQNEDDIGKYTELEMNFLLNDPDNPDQESRKSLFLFITGYIKQNARGVFLWVVLICKELKHYTRNGYSTAGLEKELRSLPKDLGGFYQRMTQRLYTDLEPLALQEARKIINWILFCQRPLTIAEIGDIIAIPFGDGIQFSPSPSFLQDHRIVGWQGVKKKMRHTCGDLLEIIQYNPGSNNIDKYSIVQLIHQTLREFLLRDNEVAKTLNTNISFGTETILGVSTRYLEVCFLDGANLPRRSRRLSNQWESPEFEAHDYHQFVETLASLPLLWYILKYLSYHLEISKYHIRDSSFEAISRCVRGWDRPGQRHILLLLERWMRETLSHPPDFDEWLLNCITPDEAAKFRSGCLLAAAQQRSPTLLLNLQVFLNVQLQEKDLNAANEVLFATATSGDATLVDVLLAAGAEPECYDKAGLTPLHYAAGNGHRTVIAQFPSGYDAPDSYGQTPLHYAAAKGHMGAVAELIQKNGIPHVRDNMGRTPLHEAAGAGYEAVVRVLLYEGTATSSKEFTVVQDHEGNTALHYAARVGNLATVETLLSFRVIVELKNKHGQTALDVAVEHGRNAVANALRTWKNV